MNEKQDLEDCFNIYCKISEALQNGDIDSLAEFIGPNLYNEYKEKEIYYKNNCLSYVFNSDKYNKNKSSITDVAKLYITSIEYVLDKDNNIIEGSNKKKNRIINIKYLKDYKHYMSRCNKCKSYYKDIESTNCTNCNQKLQKENYSIVITSIK
jgi:hypothetical protein